MKKLCFIFILTTLFSCGGNSGSSHSTPETATQDSTSERPQKPVKYVELLSPDNSVIRSSLATTAAEQTKGLQGVKDSEFAEDEGMFFFYLSEQNRSFWMPNTFFNLDILYLDKHLNIIDIVRDIPHYTGNVNAEIPRARIIKSRHVLEMKAGSFISSRLKIGDQLKWQSSLTMQETEVKIRDQL